MPDITGTHALKILEDFLYLLNNVKTHYDIYYSNVGAHDKELQNYLHELELSNLDAAGMSKLVTSLRDSRRERRKNKDEVEQLTPLINFISKQSIICEIKKLATSIRQIKQEQKTRQYKPRVITKLAT